METAWLIEGKNNTYIGSSPLVEEIYAGGSRLGWVPGHENALRLARREDAEFIKPGYSFGASYALPGQPSGYAVDVPLVLGECQIVSGSHPFYTPTGGKNTFHVRQMGEYLSVLDTRTTAAQFTIDSGTTTRLTCGIAK